MRFEWKPDLGVVLKSIDAPARPAYMRLSRSRIAWMLQNVPNQHVYDVAFGGVQAGGYAYQIVAYCGVPPLTGASSFNYQTNRSEVSTLNPNPAFVWTQCTATAVQLNARKDFHGYRSRDDAKGLDDYVALDGSSLQASP
jgi:hypothetical protein